MNRVMNLFLHKQVQVKMKHPKTKTKEKRVNETLVMSITIS